MLLMPHFSLQLTKKGTLYSMLVLFTTIAIFIATVIIMTAYSNQRAIEKADQNNSKQLLNVTNVLERELRNNRHLAFTFLSGFYDVALDSTNSWENATFSFTDKELQSYTLEDCYIGLTDFLKINPEAISVVVILEPDIIKANGRERFTPCVVRNDSTHYDISDTYEFLSSSHYQYVKRTHKPIWFFPTHTYEGRKLFTQMIPIFRENGKLLCTFVVDYPFSFVQDILGTLVPFYDRSSINIIDDEYHVRASTSEYLANIDHALRLNPTDCSPKTLSHRIRGKQTGHFLSEWEGIKYYSYHAPIHNTDFTALVFCEVDAIYSSATKTRNRLFMIAGGGCILLFLCCFLIYRILRKNLTRQAALESELQTAATLQMSLLNNAESGKTTTIHFEHSTLQTYIKPTRETGGDLYDYIEHKGHLIFMVGDVSGKGLSSAMFMTQVITLFRNAIRETTDPATIVQRINDVLARSNDNMTFCTMFVGNYHAPSQTLTFCNAGHNKPILLSSSCEPTFLSMKPNMAACLFEDYVFSNETLAFTPDMSLLVYTDGITEAKNPHHENFGNKRLLDSIKQGSTIIQNVLGAVADFVKEEPQSDDITMLLLSPAADDR